MFDYIRCDVPLPDGWHPDGPLQTKDLDCQMVTHVITKDGRLMMEQIDAVHEVPKAERPYPNDDGFLGMCGSIKTVTSAHDSNFHGVVNFYGSEYRTPDDKPARPQGVMCSGEETSDWTTGEPLKSIWHEYNAKFTNGQLVEIEAVPDSD